AVRLIDTAGVEGAAPGGIAARMRAQSEAAVGGAELGLFVLEGRAGAGPADAAFARLGRHWGRPGGPIAHNGEGRAGSEGFYDAYRLGLGEPIAISAEHGEGVADLVAAMLAALGLQSVRKRQEEVAEPDEEAGAIAAHPIRLAI